FQTAFEIPAGTALGDLEVHATDGDAEATDTSRVVDGDGSDEDGTDQDGTDQDGSDQDGAADDGGDEDGSDQDGAEDPTLVIDPDEAGVGDEITVDGEGFEPNTTVVVTYTDSEGNVVGTQEVTTDDDGAFTTSFEIPEGTALGDLEVHASDGENEATETVAIIDTAKVPPKVVSSDRATTTAGSGSGYLPRTGAEVMTLMMIAGLAVIGGAGLVSVRNMKRNRR